MSGDLKNRLLYLTLSALCVALVFAASFFFREFVSRIGIVSPNETFLAALLPGVLLADTNSDRVKNGLSLLVENPLLTRAAQLKANDMLARGYYAHVDPDGHTALYWLGQVGYKYLNAGENLDLTYQNSEQHVEDVWMNSPEHRSNILLPVFTEVGVATVSGEYQGAQATFAVEMFATPFPTTVAVAKPTYTAPISAHPVSVPISVSKPTLQTLLPMTAGTPVSPKASSVPAKVAPALAPAPSSFIATSSATPALSPTPPAPLKSTDNSVQYSVNPNTSPLLPFLVFIQKDFQHFLLIRFHQSEYIPVVFP